uniref:DDE Tnp4 domain-containing protein n=1 Tax=Cyprinus carpio TaxID=7962 RepID=A0A8C1NZ01_CYPCA
MYFEILISSESAMSIFFSHDLCKNSRAKPTAFRQIRRSSEKSNPYRTISCYRTGIQVSAFYAPIMDVDVFGTLRRNKKNKSTRRAKSRKLLRLATVISRYLNFRMPEEAFLNLCDLLHPYIPKQTMKTTVSLEKRVALTLYKLASNTEFHDVANLFGIGVSTACDVFWEVCKGLCQLKRKFIGMPKSEEDVKTIIKGFQEKSAFPMCAGALDGTHIHILAPSIFHTDYYNRKGWYSVILQGLVDHQYMFQDFDIGWPGKSHKLFQNSKLHAKLENGTCFPPLTKTIQGVDIPVLIVADSAYSLSCNVMKPFPEGVARGPQLQLNECLSRARIHVEHAFGRLKDRWHCLMKRNDSQTTNIKFVVAACIVLHNFL